MGVNPDEEVRMTTRDAVPPLIGVDLPWCFTGMNDRVACGGSKDDKFSRQ